MGDPVNSDLILQLNATLMDIKGEMGEIKALHTAALQNFATHYADDLREHQLTNARLVKIETSAERAVGSRRALAWVVSGVSALSGVGGVLAGVFLKHRGG